MFLAIKVLFPNAMNLEKYKTKVKLYKYVQ